MLHCKADVDALLRRWLAPRRPGDAACEDMARHTLVSYDAGWLDASQKYAPPAAPPARTDARHYIVRDLNSVAKFQGAPMPSELTAVQALVKLRALGARAVPLLLGSAPSEEERAFVKAVPGVRAQCASSKEKGARAQVSREGFAQRRDWLLAQGGACVRAAEPLDAGASRVAYGDLVL